MSTNEDRSWMYDRKNDSGYLKDHFVDGVNKFLEFAFSQTHLLDIDSKAKCPCKKCGNRRYFKWDDIYIHLCRWGFVPYYHVWIGHGETRNSHTLSPTHAGQSSGHNVEGPYRNLVHDAFGGQFEQENYVNPRNDAEPNSEAQAFFEMLRASERRIHSNGETTVLQWVSTFLSNKIRYNNSEAGCEKYLEQALLLLSPADQRKLPNNMYNMKKMMKGLGLGYKTFDVCVNNCFLFYGDFETSDHITCPECNEPRYAQRRNENGHSKLISRKKLWYLPLTPRLQRLYMSRKTAEHMTWHLKCQGDNDRMIHPASGEAWKHFDRCHQDFAGEARNVRLGICTDGFNPHGSSSIPYSCWPVFVTPYNLPPDLCMRPEYIFLSLIISGPKSPGKNIDVFLRPLIDELRLLWENGVETYDSFRRQNFQMRASVLWTISDFPGYGMLSQWSTHGRLSCPYCMENTKAFQLKHGRKTTFFDCHRQFLPPDHPWRWNETDFIFGRVETDAPLLRRLGPEMDDHVCTLPDVPFGNTKYFVKGFGKKHNWCRRSIFWDLPYWSTNLIRHNLDVMHCEKNFFENIKNTVMDDPDKTKDNMNARRDLELLTNRSTLFLMRAPDNKQYKRKAVYCLSRDQRKLVCEWLRNLKFPDGYASNISRCVQMQQLRLTGMKSHDCHVFMQRLIPIAFRDLLPNNVWEPLVEISNFFRALCAPDICKSDMELLESSIVVTMCKLEKIFPPSFFDSMEHLAIHLPWEAKVGGPVQYRWMYPFERRMYELKRSVRNKARIEGSICKVYLIAEIAYFCDLYFENGVETRFNRLNRNETEMGSNMESQLCVFHKKGRPIGGATCRRLNAEEYNAAQLYVLLNCPEVDCWSRLFEDEVCQGLNERQAQQKRTEYFVQWLKEHVQSGQYHVDPRVYALSRGPLFKARTYRGYIVNGFRFHTDESGGEKNTTNSGVCVKASIGAPDDTNFYGMLQEVVELEYWGSGFLQTVVLFKCHWYDITRGMNVHETYNLIDINPHRCLSTGASEPFILANQAQQVYYTPYPSQKRRRWWAVCTTRARHIVDTSSISTSNVGTTDVQDIYQDNAIPITGLVVDFSSFNLIQLADEEIVQVDEIADEDEDEEGDEYEDGVANDVGAQYDDEDDDDYL